MVLGLWVRVAGRDRATLARLVEFVDGTPDAGFVSAGLVNPDGSYQHFFGRLPTVPIVAFCYTGVGILIDRTLLGGRFRRHQLFGELGEIDRVTARTDGGAGFACTIMRRDVIEEVGFMDEAFPLFFNDGDLAARQSVRYVQLDDTNLAYLCDPKMRAGAIERGDDPDALPRTYAALINSVIDSRPEDLTVAIHLCRGNFRSQWFAEGGYEPVAEVLFNDLHVDACFLEYDDERSGEAPMMKQGPRVESIRPTRWEKKGDILLFRTK